MAGPTWLPGVIVDLLGATMAEVRLDDGRLWRRHFDQLRLGDGAADSGDPATPCDPKEPEQRRLDDEPEPPCLDRTVLGRHLADGTLSGVAGADHRLAARTDRSQLTCAGHGVSSDLTGRASGVSAGTGGGGTEGDESIVAAEPVVTTRATESPGTFRPLHQPCLKVLLFVVHSVNLADRTFTTPVHSDGQSCHRFFLFHVIC